MKILFVAVGGLDAASARVRAFGPASELARRGHDARVVESRDRVTLFQALIHTWDVIVLQKVFPAASALRVLRARTSVLVLECDDAVHLGYPGESADLVRTRLDRVQRIVSVCDAVTTTNPLIADALAPTSGRVLTLPGPAPAHAVWEHQRLPGKQVAWVGSPSTSENLMLLLDDAAVLADEWALVTVGARPEESSLLGARAVPWTPESEDEVLRDSIVGLMPLVRSPWNDSKAGYKVLQYLAHDVVPVVTDSPASRCVVGPRSAVFVSPGDSWAEAVRLASSRQDDLLAEGRAVLEQLSLPNWTDQWVTFVETL